MTKEYLKSYRMWSREIQDKTLAIEHYRTHDTVLSSVDFPYCQHAVNIYGAPPDNDGSRWKLERERAELVYRCREIERWIHKIPDPVTRRIFELRYLEGDAAPAWRDIAQKIGGGNGESGVKVRHFRYIRENL